MPSQRHPFHYALLALCALHLGFFVWREWVPTMGIEGMLYPNGTPVGGDFINLWSAGRLVLEGGLGQIYRHAEFMAYEVGLTGAPIGIRFWAYPPHSLLFAWPFGLVGFYPALLIWSALGLAVLALGCRQLGLGWLEAAIVLFSPASILCLYYGQTGNLGTGLLLLALSARPGRDWTAIGAAVVLTIKPQMGLLLPFGWLAQRRWAAIGWTVGLVLSVLLVSWLVFGSGVWTDYLQDTMPGLSLLERHGTGPFMSMIPSMFMAFRIVLGDGDLALLVHLALAVPVFLFALWKLWRLNDPLRRAGVVLAGTALLTPYLHNYDLTIVAAGALLVLRRFPGGSRGELAVCGLVALALGLPQLVVMLNLIGVPLAPLVILPLLLLA